MTATPEATPAPASNGMQVVKVGLALQRALEQMIELERLRMTKSFLLSHAEADGSLMLTTNGLAAIFGSLRASQELAQFFVDGLHKNESKDFDETTMNAVTSVRRAQADVASLLEDINQLEKELKLLTVNLKARNNGYEFLNDLEVVLDQVAEERKEKEEE